MKPTASNLIFIIICLFILRYVVLEYMPSAILNGYFAIFICFFILSFVFTRNILFSLVIGLLTINVRTLYRSMKDKSTLNDYNSFGNCFIFLLGLIVLSVILFNYPKFNKYIEKYYCYVLLIFISSNLFFLTNHNKELLCYP